MSDSWNLELNLEVVFGPSRMLEDNAYIPPDLKEWLHRTGYPYNAGYWDTGTTSRDRNTGFVTIGMTRYVQLYSRKAALHFAVAQHKLVSRILRNPCRA